MPEHETQNILGRAQCRQVNPNHRLHLDNAGGDLDEKLVGGFRLLCPQLYSIHSTLIPKSASKPWIGHCGSAVKLGSTTPFFERPRSKLFSAWGHVQSCSKARGALPAGVWIVDARAWELDFEPPLDEGIRDIVFTLIAHGVETCESYQCDGHAYHDPTVRFEGDLFERLRQSPWQ